MTADPVADYNQFQSNGACQDHCQGSYAFAVLQGYDCWCSNYIPGDQVDTITCNEQCPGYSSEWCGSTAAGLYGYYQLSAGQPLGTSGGTSATAASTSASSTPAATTTSSYYFTSSSSVSTTQTPEGSTWSSYSPAPSSSATPTPPASSSLSSLVTVATQQTSVRTTSSSMVYSASPTPSMVSVAASSSTKVCSVIFFMLQT